MAGVMQNGMQDDPLTNFRPFVSATPPPTASDAAYTPEGPLRGTIAGDPATFVAHGVSVNDLGAFPGGARASQIRPDLTGPDITAHARAGDGYGLQGPGTPELAIGAPQQGPKLDQLGYLRLGVGPAIPIVLIFGVLGVWLWTQGGRRAVFA